MSNCILSWIGRDMRVVALSPHPFGPGFGAEPIARAVKMELHDSEDTSEWRLVDAVGRIVATRKYAKKSA